MSERSTLARLAAPTVLAVAAVVSLAATALAQNPDDLIGTYPLAVVSSGADCPSDTSGTLRVLSVGSSRIVIELNGGEGTFDFDPRTETLTGDYLGQAVFRGHFTRTGDRIDVDFSITWTTLDCVSRATGSRTVGGSASATPGGNLEIGMSCATDARVVRCTASVSGQASDADLQFEWLLDGQTRPETGSRMQVDWVAEGIRTGTHSVVVTVRDARHAAVAPAVASTVFELGLSVSVSCGYRSDSGDYSVTCIAVPFNAPSTARLEYDWSYSFIDSGGGRRTGVDGSKSERFARGFGRGALTVTVVARDTANGLQSTPTSYFLAIDPIATLTELLTGGETADPQNVIDALMGAGGAAAAAALAAILGGLFGNGAGVPAPAGNAPPPPHSPGQPAPTTPTDDVSSTAADLLGAAAGEMPPLNTAADLEKWKALAGWPPGPEADMYFRNAIGNTTDMTPAQRFAFLVNEAARIRATLLRTAEPPLDVTDLLDKGVPD